MLQKSNLYQNISRILPENDWCYLQLAYLQNGVFYRFLRPSSVLMLQKRYLYQNGVEFLQNVIGAIVNLATPVLHRLQKLLS